jgi:hypothetical protein
VISAPLDRRRTALAWSTVLSLVVHALLLGAVFALLARVIVPRGTPESISQVTISSVEHYTAPKTPPVRRVVHHVAVATAAARPSRHELAKQAPRAALQPAPHPPTLEARLNRDRSAFARVVAQLDRSNDPHAIPTIDPATQESTMKSYAFQTPSSLRGEEHGNGLITPTTSWHDNGMDCYYGRYEYTYPDGAEESGAIAWHFCYEPDADPFKEPPHPMPFPPPPVGYVLPPGTYLPPIEKDFYEHWAAQDS